MIRDSIKGYKHIIWGWNGTLLDDVGIVIDTMNNLLKRRSLPLLDMEKYKNIFTFPVKDYYASCGLLGGNQDSKIKWKVYIAKRLGE